MAAAGIADEGDNPIAVNITPLVDVIFCLCVFFMISFRFRQIEGRFEVWLPKAEGSVPEHDAIICEIADVRVALFWDETTLRTVRVFGHRRVEGDEELGRLFQESRDACLRLDKPDPAVTIDAEGRVPWGDVVDVVNLCKRVRIDRIEFALPALPVEQR